MSRAAFRAWRWDGIGIGPHRGGVLMQDRGFRYGQHLFESIAVRNGKVLLVHEHLFLLKEAAIRNGIPLTRSLVTALRSFLRSVKLFDGMLRIYLTAGPGAPGAAVTEPACYLTWEGTEFPSPKELARGIRLVTLKNQVAGPGWGEKTGNYLPHLEALVAARSALGDEAIVLGENRDVVSCAMGNLLAWLPLRSGTILRTPESNARPGAVLSWVEGSVTLKRGRLTLADLRRAVALAVTNSRLGVMPVASLDGRKLSDRSPALALARDYLRSHGLRGGE